MGLLYFRIVLTKGLLYFSYHCLSKGRAFWSQQKKNHSLIGKEVERAKKLCQQADAGYWKMLLQDPMYKKLLRLSRCLTPKLMQAFHCSVFVPSCWLLFHDSFGHSRQPALWSVSRAPGLGCADTALWWPAHGKQSHTVLPWSHWTHSCGRCWLKEAWHHTAFLQAFCGLF